jgi:hypothetical protein
VCQAALSLSELERKAVNAKKSFISHHVLEFSGWNPYHMKVLTMAYLSFISATVMH